LAGDDPVPVIFGPKGTHPNMKDARFTFDMRSAVQSALADLLVFVIGLSAAGHKVASDK